MSKYNKNQDSDEAWMIDESGQTWTLGKNATITVDDEAAINIAAGNDDNLIRVKGDLVASGASGEGIRAYGEDMSIRIARSSHVEANVGLHNGAHETAIRNAGHIEGKDNGILSDVDIELDNGGRISGDTAIVASGANYVLNREGGVIEGGAVGLRLVGVAQSTIENDGVIRSDDIAMIVSGGTLVNTGKIVGDVLFGDAHDWIDTRLGKIKGIVDGGDGDDTYLVGKSAVQLSEKAEGGWDEVRSTKSLTLTDFVEELRLLGKKAIDGTGNGGSNELSGNKADNVMHGKAGNDYVGGGRGDDLLFGGSGSDDFVFSKGDDRDTVMDFNLAQDRVALLNFGFDDPVELAPLLSQHGDDTWISLGDGDRVILKDVNMEELTEDNFVFDYVVESAM